MDENRKITKKDIAFGHRLQRKRKDKELTQEQLAEKIKVSTTFITLVETGKRRPSFKTLQKIAKALGVSASELLNF